MRRNELDAQDVAILSHRAGLFWAKHTRIDTWPAVGDYVDFADGVTRRVSHVWDWATCTVQTSDGGSFYLDADGCSFSGGLFPGIDAATLTRTGETREGRVWFFHHNHATAHNGVETTMPFAVYSCTLPARR